MKKVVATLDLGICVKAAYAEDIHHPTRHHMIHIKVTDIYGNASAGLSFRTAQDASECMVALSKAIEAKGSK